ncbi:hypothetical protein FEM48_Zijuj05G0140700 [Ziziphus jujuba var. spinosa]|uniref:Peroxidase n=1 Tax=Ziziphus jujuba var. spinosa TaxID=714518 RepID=A0A978VF95_ZIZJJ|nr:hypothetical protein FEM48_Zijuj05G0140700 [Ziziphus jujuba var. spinosa]
MSKLSTKVYLCPLKPLLLLLSSHAWCVASVLFLFLLLQSTTSKAQLSSTFYDTTCPNAVATIRTSIRAAVSQERRMAASLICLHFHDCFVQGCDASILLEESSSIRSEQSALVNSGARGYQVIEAEKSELEKLCPRVVSSFILSVAARDASVAVGGPSWTVKLGRRDSTTASLGGANSDLPSFRASLEILISAFAAKGLSARDMVAFNIDAGFATTRRRRCTPADADNGHLASLDLVMPNSFENNYFKNLIQKKGLLESDQVLFSGGSTDSFVSEYSRNPISFFDRLCLCHG